MLSLSVLCPRCGESLMDPSHTIEEYPGIQVILRWNEREERIHLSSIYGSYRFDSPFPIPEGTVTEFVCPACRESLRENVTCSLCDAPMCTFRVEDGPFVSICSRRGCPNHAIRFGTWTDIPISSIMRRGIVTVTRSTPLKQILTILLNTDMHILPVVDEEQKLLGVLSVFDLLHHLIPQEVGEIDFVTYRKLLHCHMDFDQLTIGDIMTSDVPTLPPESSLEDAVVLIQKSCKPTLFVVKEGAILGIIDISDLCKALIERRREGN
ncbi:MAG TPA: CBS domain-containing protein [Thermoanaerobaculia bacterium]|nr:CBS domain-containing protein [Thermoanaerobaculia bacterium]HUM29833.1 CBS domain-containing protein [Thermoanaerobaculia bacterium]HXK68108.1 CBS domain-containing protein [Thermoanaerobaculia bacterium]